MQRMRLGVSGGWPLSGALAAVFLGAVDLTVISTVLPHIVIDLQINTADIDRYIWVVNAYLIAYIVAIPVVGRISDLVGRRAAFQCALALFLLGSLLSGFAGSLNALIAARAIQGAGGGALLPITMALVGDLLPPGRRVTALGLVGAIDTLGWVLGPIWGASVVGVASNAADAWRWVFWSNIPIGLAIGFVIHRQIKPKPKEAGERGWRVLDWLGAMLLGAALLLLNLGLSSGGESGISSGSAFRALGGTHNPLAEYLPYLIASGIVALGAFLWRQRITSNPLLPLRLFTNRTFAASQLANFLVGASLIAVMVDVPLSVALLADSDRISTVSALLLAPFTFLMAGASLIGGVLSSSRGERATALAGLVLVGIGFLALWIGLRNDHYIWMLPGLAVSGAGFGLVVAPIGASAIEEAPDEQRGIAAASTILFRLLGMTMSLSALTAFGIHRLQSLSSKVEPIVRSPDETTAEYFVRQNQFISDIAIPMTVRVVRETFLLAGGIALLAIISVALISHSARSQVER